MSSSSAPVASRSTSSPIEDLTAELESSCPTRRQPEGAAGCPPAAGRLTGQAGSGQEAMGLMVAAAEPVTGRPCPGQQPAASPRLPCRVQEEASQGTK